MIRRTRILTTAALLAVCAVPAYADAKVIQPVPPPPSSIATSAGQSYTDLRSPDARDAGVAAQVKQDLRSPDARDAGRPESPPVPTPIVQIREVPTSGFDWGDAGIGAAAILALSSIAAGFALLLTTRRRRRGFEVATH
jgi:hypothetical protein